MSNSIFFILGIIVTYFFGKYFYNKSKMEKKLNYTKKSSTLIDRLNDDFYKDIKITFQNQKIDKLTSTVFCIWNSGNSSIRSDDIALKSPLQIKQSNESMILTTRIIKQSREVCDLRISEGDNLNHIIPIKFDYLDTNDGVLCEIVHTGENDDLTIFGEIIGSHKGLVSIDEQRKNREKYIKPIKLSSYIISLISYAMIFSLFAYAKYDDNNTQKYYIILLIFLFSIFSFFSIILLLLFSIIDDRKKKKEIPPSSLEYT